MRRPPYKVMLTTWWMPNPAYPGGREPHYSVIRIIGYFDTEAEAVAKCHEYNSTHEPGPWSIKAEWERIR